MIILFCQTPIRHTMNKKKKLTESRIIFFNWFFFSKVAGYSQNWSTVYIFKEGVDCFSYLSLIFQSFYLLTRFIPVKIAAISFPETKLLGVVIFQKGTC